ncbi:unnamed protein product [Paramecium sonneborni]|uniref:Uncharacterized protein n=1 Tax=Paramecium sonneborni TaxID=65129 RepID=A0A8S1Q2P1_9CILI|nr:unnamed protein product [Paramecium sonneborni]
MDQKVTRRKLVLFINMANSFQSVIGDKKQLFYFNFRYGKSKENSSSIEIPCSTLNLLIPLTRRSSIFSQQDSNANCEFLKQLKQRKVSKNFFKQIIITIQLQILFLEQKYNQTSISIKKVYQIIMVINQRFEFVTILEQKLYLFSDDQMRELIELLFLVVQLLIQVDILVQRMQLIRHNIK